MESESNNKSINDALKSTHENLLDLKHEKHDDLIVNGNKNSNDIALNSKIVNYTEVKEEQGNEHNEFELNLKEQILSKIKNNIEDDNLKEINDKIQSNLERKVQFDDHLIKNSNESDQLDDSITNDQLIDELIKKQNLNVFNSLTLSSDTKSTNFCKLKQQQQTNNQSNLINQIDEQVSNFSINDTNNLKINKNSNQHNHQNLLNNLNKKNSNHCKRRHSTNQNVQSNYNTFSLSSANDKYLQTSVPLTNNQPNHQSNRFWSKFLNTFYRNKDYETLNESTEHLDQIKNNSKFSSYQNCSHNSSFDNSSITNFFQTVITTQRSLVNSMTATSNSLDFHPDQFKPPNKTPSRANSVSYLSSTGIQLKQNLGLLNGVCIIVGVIVGSGIFISPKGVLESSHSVGLSLSIWICCGLLSLIGALCYAELFVYCYCAVPKSGGDYAYIKEAFGDLPAFLFLWVATLIIMPTGNAIAALTFANYVLVPYYRFVGCGDPPEQAVQLIAIILVLFLTFINCYNVRWSAFLMDAFTFAKVFALTIIVGVGFWQICKGSTHNFENMWHGSSTSPQQIALSFYAGLFSYAGWNFLNFVTEELKDPFNTLPKAIYISLPLVTIIYVLANVAYFTVLSPTEIVDSNAVAITFGDRVLGAFSWTMPLFVVLSTFGGLNGSIFTSSRLFFVGARNGHLPRVLGQINVNYYTPVPSLLFMCLTTLVYLSTANVYLLINYTAFNESLFITLSVASLLWLRYKQPDLERPIRVNIILPIFFFVVCTFLVLLPVFEKPMETGISALITLGGVPVYWCTIGWKNKPALYNKINDSITRFLQILLITVEEKKS